MIEKLGVLEVKLIAHRLAKEHLGFDEPIPEFGSRFPNILESSLAVPFQHFSGKPVYKGLIGKAAILFYLMIKNHPFQNLPAPRPGKYYFYVLECNNGNLYKGSTNNLARRLEEHIMAKSGWTSKHRPFELKYFEEFDTREEVLKREHMLKTGFGRKWLKKKIDSVASRQAGGNKRVAITTLLIFFYKNKKWLKVSNQELYNFAVWVAQSPAGLKDEVVLGIEKFLKKYMVKESKK